MQGQANQANIVIIGGGMVGVSFALAMRAADPECRAHVTLIETFPLKFSAEQPEYTPSFDVRSTALSWGSRHIYESLDCWERLRENCCPIRTIHVSEAGRFGCTRIEHQQEDVEALGYVVENHWLGRSLLYDLGERPEVSLLAPATVEQLSATDCGYTLKYRSGDALGTLDADLVIVADGGKSGLREQLGIQQQATDYAQRAMVFNVQTEQPHQGIAYERFTQSGPMAMLPLVGDRGAVIWSLGSEESAAVEELDDADFIGAFQKQFGYRLGRVLRVGQRSAYPLVLTTVNEQVRPGLVVLGNAAHTLHPVAGQGYNLALRDADALASDLGQTLSEGASPGDLATLLRYQNRRSEDQDRIVGFTDGLNRLFTSERRDLSAFRKGAMLSLELLPGLKHLLARQAMGVGA